MVVTRKPGQEPPPPNSRTNSARNLHQTKPILKAVPSTTLPTSPPKKKQKIQKKHKQPPKPSVFDRLLGWLLPLVVIYIALVCPSDAALKNPVCRSLSLYSDHVLRPYILPPIQKALDHPAIQPYVEKAVQFERTVEPYVVTAAVKTTPYVIKTKQLVWDRAALPVYRRYILPQFYIHIYPHILKLYSKVDPYITPIHQKSTAFVTKTSYLLHRLDTATRPYLHRAYVTTKPYAIRLYEVTRPLVARAYDSGKAYAIKAYVIAKPYVRLAYFRTTKRARYYTRKVTLLRKQYVDKHVLRIWEKVNELSGSRDTVSASRPSSTDKETAAQSVDSTTSTSSSFTIAEASQTTETVSTPSVVEPEPAIGFEPSVVEPEEEVKLDATETVDASEAASSVMTESASSSQPDSSSSVTPEPTPSPRVEAEDSHDLSASSVIMENVLPSSVPTDSSDDSELPPSMPIEPSDVSQIPSAASVPVMMEFSAPSSVPVESVSSSSIFASAASTAGTPQSDEEDLDDLLRDLGLSSEPEPDIQEILDEPPVEEKPISPAEKEEERRKRQAEKRVDITGRHAKWAEKLDELIKVRKKSVRKMLVRVRKGSVRALWDKSDETPADDGTSPEDVEKMRYIEGERVGFLLDNLAAEGEKLLKGLDLYLKKEEKAVKSNPGDLKDKVRKWETFLEKVEDKFSDSCTALRGKVHRWFIQVRDIEIRECLAASDEVKALADKAQMDIGLDYAWLDDVTYNDWQRYHDLMRAHEGFDEQVRMIQNGTHPSPPIDPVVPALDKLQVEMNEIVVGWQTRVRSLNSKALHEIFVEAQEPEPEVSILPIDPRPAAEEEGGFDASNVIIGKSEAQIKQALEDIPVVHEEL